VIEAASQAMELALQQGRDVVLIEVLYLFKALVEKGQGYEKAIEAPLKQWNWRYSKVEMLY
jgi:hypothetical protein